MNELDLLDKSNNDYQLVNDISKIVRSYKDKNKPVDMDFAKKVYNCCLENDNVNYCEIKSDSDDLSYGYFDSDAIYLNYSMFDYYFDELKDAERFNNLGDHNMIKYHFLISTILHEFTHAKQYYIAFNNNINMMASIYQFCFEVNIFNPSFYQFYYDYIPIERYANIRSYFLANKVMEKVYGDKSLLLFKTIFLTHLIKDYEINYSPLGTFNDICNNYGYTEFSEYMPNYNITDDNLWERLCCGVEIKPEEYIYLHNFYSHLVDDSDSYCWNEIKNKDIKKLIMSYGIKRN